jgi:homoserine kinase
LVEPQRAHLIPHFYEMKEAAIHAGALGFSISGAGPSMFALCDNSIKAESVIEAAKKLYQAKKLSINTYLSKINHEGAIRF